MPVETTYKINLDFEQQLYNQDWRHQRQKWLRLNCEWEYLYFFCSTNPLLPEVVYSKEDLKRYQDLGLTISLADKKQAAQASNWWGDTSNLEHERVLNDKTLALNISKKLGVAHFSNLVMGKDELIQLASKFKQLCFVRCRHGQSGKNLKLFTDGEALIRFIATSQFINGPFNKSLSRGEGLLMGPWLQRDIDLGTRWWPEGEFKIWFNLVDHFGIFRGGVYGADNDFARKVLTSYGVDMVLLLDTQRSAFKYYWDNHQLQDSIQFDSFLADGTLVPLQEANHRKTMGDVLRHLQGRFSPEHLGFFIIEKNEPIPSAIELKRQEFLYHVKKKTGIMRLTPLSGDYQFLSYFVGVANRAELTRVRECFPEFFNGRDELLTKLYNVFSA